MPHVVVTVNRCPVLGRVPQREGEGFNRGNEDASLTRKLVDHLNKQPRSLDSRCHPHLRLSEGASGAMSAAISGVKVRRLQKFVSYSFVAVRATNHCPIIREISIGVARFKQ